jgi:serine/threonine protein kinase
MTGRTILHYKILEKLGEGGMDLVYKDQDTKLKRDVALKFLPTNMLQGEAEKERFVREAQAAAALNHANITHIYAIEEMDDQVFIAMEYIKGKSLHEMITPLNPALARGDIGGSPMALDKAIDTATQIAAGLQAAHEKGVIHRDMKSANIMVTDKGVVKIMDFGLAKLANRSKMTQLGTTVGTAAYMSPEQARGEEADNRSDIWSLGVVLYEMISGQLPFKGDYEQAVIYAIFNEEPEPLTALRSGLPIALDGIIAKALAKDPATRYQHVDELPADLKALDSA